MRNLVNKIPKDRLFEIIEKNIIANAVPISSNAYMKFLFVIWYNYFQPNEKGNLDCPYCLQNVYDNFKGMQATMLEVYREHKALEEL